MAMRLVAVVVTHDRLEQLRRTLGRLLAEPAEVLGAVVVVDNASTDGSAQWLDRQEDPRLTVLHSAVNLGGAGGFEAGLRHVATHLDPDWTLVMDDDARPEPGALAAFLAQEPAGWDAAAAAVRLPDGAVCAMNRPVLNPFWHPGTFWRTALGGGRAAFHLDDAAFAPGAPPRAVDAASFVGLFLSRAAFARAGFPDGRLFVYADDTIYTLGLTRAGGRIVFLPGIRFEHDCRTLGGGRFRPLWKVYYYHRNLLILYRLAAGRMFWPAMAVVLPRWLWKARRHAGSRRVFLRLLRRAVADGLAGRMAVPHAEILALAGPRHDSAGRDSGGAGLGPPRG